MDRVALLLFKKLVLIAEQRFCCQVLHSGANPTITTYNACVVKYYNKLYCKVL
jgi:hypothetical protein